VASHGLTRLKPASEQVVSIESAVANKSSELQQLEAKRDVAMQEASAAELKVHDLRKRNPAA
jgi:hypothetical protein